MIAAIDEIEGDGRGRLEPALLDATRPFSEMGARIELKRFVFAGARSDHVLLCTIWEDTDGVARMRRHVQESGDPVLLIPLSVRRVAASIATDLRDPLDSPPPPDSVDVVTVIRPTGAVPALARELLEAAAALESRGAQVRIWQHVFGDDWSGTVWFVNRHQDFAEFAAFGAALPPELRVPVRVAEAGVGATVGRFVLEEVRR